MTGGERVPKRMKQPTRGETFATVRVIGYDRAVGLKHARAPDGEI